MLYPNLYEFLRTHCDATVAAELKEDTMHIDIHFEIQLPSWLTEWYRGST